ncbi:MAG: hypothetical protein Q3965_05480 [Rothia sp. (in: high G+C Gram-positive bacteria)]|nr:hypothetical protein [Rothia sp. (in: high G+C Gram-positive bacteria)]
MTIAVYCLLGLLALLSTVWARSNKPTGARAATLIALLVITSLITALPAPPSSPGVRIAIVTAVLFSAAFGGSIPAAFFVGKLHAKAPEETPRPQSIKGRIGPLPLHAELHNPTREKEVEGGGRLIGIFERVAVAICLVTAQISLLAAIVAIKGLARYPDIKTGHLTAEKFIVGTFVSLLWATGCAIIASNLV